MLPHWLSDFAADLVMNLDALRSLQEQASGPEPVPDLDKCTNIDPCPECQGMYDWIEANEKLSALGKHLLPIAEALELLLAIRKPAVPPNPRDAVAEKACKALKALQEALE